MKISLKNIGIVGLFFIGALTVLFLFPRDRENQLWQWQLTDAVDVSVNAAMFDIDLFETSEETIQELHKKSSTVICYFSAGTYEAWRPDASLFPKKSIGLPLEDFPDERWLDIRSTALRPILNARLDLAVNKGCDGVEPDNVDGYQNETGFSLTPQNQLAFNRWLSQEAHTRGLSVGLKNDLDQIPDLVESFDWALNEQCFEFDECEKLLPFTAQGKPVYGVEYQGSPEDFCPKARKLGFQWMKKNLSLDAHRVPCR